MAVRLDINARVSGTSRVNALNRAVVRSGRAARNAAGGFVALEAAAARGRASMAALATTMNVAVLGAIAAVGIGIAKFTSATFSTGNLLEGLAVRFELLFGSVEEGAKAFDELANFAARVPFSLGDIAAGSGNLAVVASDAEDLARLLEVTGNVAAATGLDFRQTAEQIQRAFAGGIAAADVFRERGVRAMLGFESGVTVSIAETVQRFDEVFGPGGQFGQATGLLAETLTGQFSLVDDAFFTFRRNIADTFFTGLTAQIRGVVEELGENQALLEDIARNIGEGVAVAFVKLEAAGRFVIANLSTISDAIKALIAFKLAGIVAGIAIAFIQFGAALLTTAKSVGILNAVLRLNPIGLLVTAIQLAVAGFIFFREEITGATRVALEFVGAQFTRLQDIVIRFIRVLNFIPGVNLEIETSVERLDREFSKIEDRAESIANGAMDIANAFEESANAGKELAASLDAINSSQAGADIFQREVNDGGAANAAAEALQAESEAASVITGIANRRFQDLVTNSIKESVAPAKTLRDSIESLGITSSVVGNTIADQWVEGFRQGDTILQRIQNSAKALLQTVIETIIRNTINLGVEKLFEQLGNKKVENEKRLNAEKNKGFLISTAEAALSSVRSIGGFLGFQDGGIVPNTPGSTPGRDSVPALLTPGERVIPKSDVDSGGSGTTYVTNITQNLSTRNLNDALIEAIRTQAEDVNAILESERNNQ